MTGAERALARYVTGMGVPSGAWLGGLYFIVWVDSHQRPGWTTDEPQSKPLKCISVGFLASKNAEAVTLSASLSVEDNQQRCGDMTIPLRAILKMKRLL